MFFLILADPCYQLVTDLYKVNLVVLSLLVVYSKQQAFKISHHKAFVLSFHNLSCVLARVLMLKFLVKFSNNPENLQRSHIENHYICWLKKVFLF